MKNLVLLSVFLGVIVATMALTKEEIKESVEKLKKECTAETGVTEEELIKAKKENKLEKDSKIPEFLVCFFKKCGFLNAEGEIDGEVIKKKLVHTFSEEKSAEIAEECSKDKPKAGEEAAIHLAVCLHKHHKEENAEV